MSTLVKCFVNELVKRFEQRTELRIDDVKVEEKKRHSETIFSIQLFSGGSMVAACHVTSNTLELASRSAYLHEGVTYSIGGLAHDMVKRFDVGALRVHNPSPQDLP